MFYNNIETYVKYDITYIFIRFLLMNYRITDLSNFIETSLCRTMTEASLKLQISQPALSESIKRLESDYGSSIFYRSRSGIQLTPDGRILLGKAKAVINTLKSIDKVHDNKNLFNGRSISIGCHATVAAYTLPQTLKNIKKIAPDYEISLKHDLSRNIQLDVQRGNLDVGIIINPSSVPDLVIQKLSKDIVAIWQANRKSFDSDLVVYDQDLFQSQSILKKWKKRPSKSLNTSSLELICRLTEKGIGYGIIPQKVVNLFSKKISRVPGLPNFEDEISIVYRPEFGRSDIERLVIDSIKSSLN